MFVLQKLVEGGKKKFQVKDDKIMIPSRKCENNSKSKNEKIIPSKIANSKSKMRKNFGVQNAKIILSPNEKKIQVEAFKNFLSSKRESIQTIDSFKVQHDIG